MGWLVRADSSAARVTARVRAASMYGERTRVGSLRPTASTKAWSCASMPEAPDRTSSGMLLQDQAFVEAVARKDPTRVRSPYVDAARTLAVTLAAEESARTNTPIEVPKL